MITADTGVVPSTHTTRGNAAGAVDYINKPFHPKAPRAKVAVFTSIYLAPHTP